MIQILFLLLVVTISSTFAQNSIRPKLRLTDEFARATNGDVKRRMQLFYTELANDPSAQGYIINYGNDREIARREGQIRDAFTFLNIDAQRITIVNAGPRAEIKTEFWLVPAGAESPVPGTEDENFISKFELTRLEEFGEVSDKFFKQIFNLFFEKVKTNNKINGYIVLRGTDGETAAFETKIRNLEFYDFYNSDKIKILKLAPVKKQPTIALWLVPETVQFSGEPNKK